MEYVIEVIKPEHDDKVCQIIKHVGAEYGAVGEGFGPGDAEVLAMSQHYNDETASCYLVATVSGIVVGGCGIAAVNAGSETCELRKLFLLPESRGLGLGQRLAEHCLDYAKQKGYQHCYLDTLSNMKTAIALYEKLGFMHLDKPLAVSIHNGCDIWMLKQL